LIVYHRAMKQTRDLGTRKSLADVAATVAENFDLASPSGASFLEAVSD
jgi:phosphopentomutase